MNLQPCSAEADKKARRNKALVEVDICGIHNEVTAERRHRSRGGMPGGAAAKASTPPLGELHDTGEAKSGDEDERLPDDFLNAESRAKGAVRKEGGSSVDVFAAAPPGVPLRSDRKKLPQKPRGDKGELLSSEIRIRALVPADIPALLELEDQSWPPAMRHTREELLERINAGPAMANFCFTLHDRVVGVIYSQRVDGMAGISKERWKTERRLASASGSMLQLLRVNTFLDNPPELTVGATLREHCLGYANDLGLSQVCAVTRTSQYPQTEGQTYAEYVAWRDPATGNSRDRGLNFHLARGAKVSRALPGWRPEDVANEGHGVLIYYQLEALAAQVVEQVVPCLKSVYSRKPY